MLARIANALNNVELGADLTSQGVLDVMLARFFQMIFEVKNCNASKIGASPAPSLRFELQKSGDGDLDKVFSGGHRFPYPYVDK